MYAPLTADYRKNDTGKKENQLSVKINEAENQKRLTQLSWAANKNARQKPSRLIHLKISTRKCDLFSRDWVGRE